MPRQLVSGMGMGGRALAVAALVAVLLCGVALVTAQPNLSVLYYTGSAYVPIANGDYLPSIADGTDIPAGVFYSQTYRTFNLLNSGNETLTYGGAGFVFSNPAYGAAPSNYPSPYMVYGASTPSPTAPGSMPSYGFYVRYTSTSGVVGQTWTYNMTWFTNSGRGTLVPYTFTIKFRITGPALQVLSSVVPGSTYLPRQLISGEAVAYAASTDFGDLSLGSSNWTAPSRTFVLKQFDAGFTLTLTGAPTMTGAHATDFIITQGYAASTTVAFGATRNITVQFIPTGTGHRYATLTLTTSDPSNPTFIILLTGFGGLESTFLVGQPLGAGVNESMVIAYGDSTPSLLDGTDFGSVAYPSSVSNHFTLVQNDTYDVNATIAINGTIRVMGSTQFTVGGALSGTLRNGETLTFNVIFTPTTWGLHQAQVHIDTSDGRTRYFVVQAWGTGFGVLGVTGSGGVAVVDGGAARVVDGSDFGSRQIWMPSSAHTFTIVNTGDAAIALGAITKTGANCTDFIVTTPSQSSVTAAANATFDVSFNATSVDIRACALTVSGVANTLPVTLTYNLIGVGFDTRFMNLTVTTPLGNIFGSGAIAASSTEFQFPVQTVAAGATTKTFTVTNTGTRALTLLAATVTGASAQFSVAMTTGTLHAGASLPVTVTFNPSQGAFTTIVSITSNAVPSVFTFGISGLATSSGPAEPVVFAGTSTTAIPAGVGITPTVAAGTLFSAIAVQGNMIYLTFTITNFGATPLIFSGDPTFNSGDGNFTVWSSLASTTLASGASTQFTARWYRSLTDAAVWGLRTSTCVISSNGVTQFYQFTVGVFIPNGPVFGMRNYVAPSNTFDIPTGSTGGNLTLGTVVTVAAGTYYQLYLYMRNTGVGALRVTSNTYTVTPTPGYVQQYPSATSVTSVAGGSTSTWWIYVQVSDAVSYTFSWSLVHNAPNVASPYTFQVVMNGTGPEYQLYGPTGVALASSDYSPTVAKGTIWATAAVNSVAYHPFTIANIGTADLTISSTSTSSCSYVSLQLGSATVAAGSSTVLQVIYSPTAVQSTTGCYLYIYTNDYTESSSIIYVQYSANIPVYDVLDGAAVLVTGVSLVNFGDQAVTALPVRSITITNSASSLVPLDNLVVSSNLVANFSVTQPLLTTLAIGQSTTFTVVLHPYEGISSAGITVVGNFGSFTFYVQGRGVPGPSIYLSGDGGSGASRITLGAGTTNVVDGTQFGTRATTASALTRTFTIGNEGNLGLGSIVITSSGNTGDFVISRLNTATTLAAGATTTFTVSFLPLATGSRYATISVASSDSVRSPFTFRLGGWGAGAIIAVYGGLKQISEGSTILSGGDLTDFGAANVVSATIARQFTIVNTGDADLTVSAVTIGGADSALFTITSPLVVSLLTPGAKAAFGVTFDPAVMGTFTASITITNSDMTRGSFTFAIGGRGTVSPAGPPTSVSAVAGVRQATVHFTAPTNTGGGTITSFSVTSVPDGIVVTGTASPINVTGLNVGVKYEFIVMAWNGAGQGAASLASNLVAPVASSNELLDSTNNDGRGGQTQTVLTGDDDESKGFITKDVGGSVGILLVIIIVAVVLIVLAIMFRGRCARPASSSSSSSKEKMRQDTSDVPMTTVGVADRTSAASSGGVRTTEVAPAPASKREDPSHFGGISSEQVAQAD